MQTLGIPFLLIPEKAALSPGHEAAGPGLMPARQADGSVQANGVEEQTLNHLSTCLWALIPADDGLAFLKIKQSSIMQNDFQFDYGQMWDLNFRVLN